MIVASCLEWGSGKTCKSLRGRRSLDGVVLADDIDHACDEVLERPRLSRAWGGLDFDVEANRVVAALTRQVEDFTEGRDSFTGTTLPWWRGESNRVGVEGAAVE